MLISDPRLQPEPKGDVLAKKKLNVMQKLRFDIGLVETLLQSHSRINSHLSQTGISVTINKQPRPTRKQHNYPRTQSSLWVAKARQKWPRRRERSLRRLPGERLHATVKKAILTLTTTRINNQRARDGKCAAQTGRYREEKTFITPRAELQSAVLDLTMLSQHKR